MHRPGRRRGRKRARRARSRSRPGHLTVVAAVVVGSAAVLAFLGAGEEPGARRSVLLLERRILGEYLDALSASGEPVVPAGGLLVTVGENALATALDELLPWEGDFGAVRLHLDRAVVKLGRGLAVVDLEGTAVTTRPAGVEADVAVVAALYVDRLDEASGALRTRVEVLGIRSGPGGPATPVVRALDRVAEEVFGEVSRLLGRVELPLMVMHDLELPGVHDDDVTIPPARLPLDLAIRRVLVMEGRIWVSLTSAIRLTARPLDPESSSASDAASSSPTSEGTSSRPSARIPGRASSPTRRCGTSLIDRLRPGCPSGRELRNEAWLTRRVATLADSVSDRLRADSGAVAVLADSGDVVVRMDTRLLEAVVARGSRAYLDRVELHIRDDVNVDDQGEVSGGIGPLDIPLGSWTVRVTIHGIEATLRAEEPAVEVADRNRLSLRIPVRADSARGRVRLLFQWDAAAVPGLLCEDFEFDRTFDAVVPAFRHDVVGFFEFRNEGGRLIADPVQTNEVRIRPEAPPEAWRAVREALEERDGMLDCGLGMDPGALEARLRTRLARGFTFDLPESILRPIPVPVHFRRDPTPDARDDPRRPPGDSLPDRASPRVTDVTVRPLTLDLRPGSLQYSVRVSGGGGGERGSGGGAVDGGGAPRGDGG